MRVLFLLPALLGQCDVAYAMAAAGDFVHLVQRANDSIVNVVSIDEWDSELDRSEINSFNARLSRRRKGMGAGFFIDSQGNVVTNAHVVTKAAMVFVQTHGSLVLHRARIKGAEPRYDLALLSTGLGKTTALPMSKKGTPPVGSWVGIIGNPLGIGTTLSVGVIGAVGRSVVSEKFEDYLQISASVNPGNSGGPVLDLDGEVVGVLTMKASGYNVEGVAFAIPAYIVREVASQLVDTGYFRRVWIGVEVSDLGLEERRTVPRRGGALVTGIWEESPASHSDLRVGDIVVRLNGRPLRDGRDLAHRLLTVRQTDGLHFVVIGEDGTPRNVDVPFELEDDSYQRKDKYVKSLELGLTLQELTPHLRMRWDLPDSVSGLLVTRVAGNKRGAQSGLQAGDVLHEVGERSVRELRDFVVTLHDCLEKGPCSIVLFRNGEKRTIRITPL